MSTHHRGYKTQRNSSSGKTRTETVWRIVSKGKGLGTATREAVLEAQEVERKKLAKAKNKKGTGFHEGMARKYPGISYACAQKWHSSCAKKTCPCPCGHKTFGETK